MAGVVRISIVGRATDAIRALRQTERQANQTERGISGLNREINRLGGSGSTFGAVASILASKMALLGVGVLSVVQPAVALGAALAPLAGLVIAIPALALAAGGALGAFKLAISGVGDALKQGFGPAQTSAFESAMSAYRAASRGTVTAAEAYKAASRGLRSAQERELGAQKALTDARAKAKGQLEDFADTVAGLADSEESARLALARAKRALRVSDTFDDLQRREELLAVSEAEHNLARVLKDGARQRGEMNEANARGVEGNADVIDAQKALRDSNEGLREAQTALAAAQQGQVEAQTALIDSQKELNSSTEEYGKALAGLSGPTRQFVESIVGLKPALGLLRDSVSANFFAGFSRDVKPLAAVYLPLLRVGLSGIAKSLGGLVSGVGKALASPVFTKGVGDVLRDTAEAIKLATPGVSRLTKSFGRLFSVGSPLLLKLGKAIGDLADKFAKFIDKSAGNGALTRWLDKATKAFGELWDITGNLLSIIGSIFSVGGEGSGGLLANIRELTGRFSAFLKTGEGRAQLREFFAKLSEISKTIWSLLVAIAPIVLAVAGFFSREILPAVRSIAEYFRNHQGQLQAILIAALALKLMWGGINAAILIASVSQRAFAAINILSGAGAGAGSAAGAATAGKFVGAFTAVAAAGFASYFGTTWLLKATGWDQAIARFGQRLGEADSPWAFIGRQFVNGLSAVFTWLGSLPGRVFNIGFQIVEGLKRGIAAAVAQALGFFASIGTSILNSIKSKLGIRSPSRAAALIGQQFMAGLIGGLKTGLPQLSTTIGGVSSALTGGFSTAALSGTTASIAPGAGANGGTVINVNVPPTADMASVGRTLIDAVKAYEKSSGRVVLVPGF